MCGVPQGSILGPLLFLIYINDLPKVSNKVLPLMFADDSNIFIEGNNILTMQNELNMEMIKISSWLKANKLSLNIYKTHFMLFKGKRKIKDEINIKIDHTQIKQTQCTKFLGVQIDDKITWKNHIIYIYIKKGGQRLRYTLQNTKSSRQGNIEESIFLIYLSLSNILCTCMGQFCENVFRSPTEIPKENCKSHNFFEI